MTRQGRLKDRRILITGGASGIGLAAVELFRREGARVAVLDRDANAAAHLRDAGVDYVGAADVGRMEEVSEHVAAAARALDGLDGLINSAGISRAQTLEESDLATWQLVLDVNLTGAFNVARSALPHLLSSSRATIVNVSSAVALRPFAGLGAYAASKAGMIAWTKVLAQELAPRIRVNALCPGSTDTPLMRANMPSGPDREAFISQYAMRRQGTVVEQAQAMLYLSSDESSFVTGSTLVVDGGRAFH